MQLAVIRAEGVEGTQRTRAGLSPAAVLSTVPEGCYSTLGHRDQTTCGRPLPGEHAHPVWLVLTFPPVGLHGGHTEVSCDLLEHDTRLPPGGVKTTAEAEEPMTFSMLVPVETLLELPPEQLAERLLRHLAELEASGRLHAMNFSSQCGKEYGHGKDAENAVLEIWNVLEREGFLAPSEKDFYFVTRRGHGALKAPSFESFRIASLLPKDVLHAAIVSRTWGAFVMGRYDTAVFEAYKQLEIAVRDASGLPQSLVGVPLMRKAFDPDSGPLRDKEAERGEQEALTNLFAGAIGSYKSPYSHRNVAIEPKEAVEIIILASHLLSIVDGRRSRNAST